MPCSPSKSKASKEDTEIVPCCINKNFPEDAGNKKSLEYCGKTDFGAFAAQGALVKVNLSVGFEDFTVGEGLVDSVL